MLKLSNEALGAVMMALQKSLLEQSDIVPILKGFNFKASESGELFVMNNFSTTIQNHDGNEEVGSVVKEKIEDFKNDLKQEKKRLSRQEYEND